MRNLFLLFFFLPSFCFSQEVLLRSWDDVWINGKLKVFGIKDRRSIDSVLGKPDSIYTTGMDIMGFGPMYFADTFISYSNADFEFLYGQYHVSSINFEKRPKDVFVNFGTQILTSETTIDDMRRHFDLHNYLDSAEYTEILAGRTIRVRRLEYSPKVDWTDGPSWIFDFFENKLITISFLPGGA